MLSMVRFHPTPFHITQGHVLIPFILTVFLDVVHPQTGSSGGCAFANAIAALPTPSAIMTCPFASSKAPAPPHKATEFPPTPPMTPIASAFDLQPVLSSAPALPAGHPSVASTPECEPLDTSFLARMRQYMPGTHADWLIDLKTQSIRGLVQSNPTLQPAYDSCILGLKKFRDNHIRVVARYVICPARSVPKAVDAETLPVRGTGGTSLLPLLKHYRDNTIGQLFGSYDP